ncbi:hypothetical protein UCD39_26390 [Nitrospirillum sp. BR 11752]|uniref:Uncharacterized protein n=1 Tax=Nitrospirillum amazonense TaxID=28077 RepID=A0A560H486_9PROT|nr:hypothetical protein [Nitrospirillum amazonense]MEE3627462.1 hypothetical protein [Nitrospirillum sp. BR 11752]TWB41116.1 hypothetical protein FBZ90_108140 [Nitrospirillum amazonense]
MTSRAMLIGVAILASGAIGFGYTFIKSSHPDVATLRKNMAGGMMEQCVKAARAAPGISESQVQTYCGCNTTKLNAALSDDEVKHLVDLEHQGQTGVPPELAPKLDLISNACRKEAQIPG